MSQEKLINLGLISIEKEFPSFDVKKVEWFKFFQTRDHI